MRISYPDTLQNNMHTVMANQVLEQAGAVNVLGVRVNTLPVQAVIDFIAQTVLNRDKAIVTYANVYAVNLAQEVPWFRNFLNQSALTFCDGYGLRLGASLLGQEIPYRFTPPDWFPFLASTAAELGFTFYFLGARPGVADKCSRLLREQIHDLKIVGVRDGYFVKSEGSAENETVIQDINNHHPDIVVVGFGMPLQEKWLLDNWNRIEARVALPVGAMFDYLAHEIPRAPSWMTDHGLEWLGRLIFEPKRLWERYLVGNPRFFFRILKQRFLPVE